MRVSTLERKTAKISKLVKGDVFAENGEYFEVQSYPVSFAQGMVTLRLRRIDGTNKTRTRAYDYADDIRVNLVK